MNGSIEKRGQKSWRITIYTGKDVNGKWKRETKTIRGTKADAERKKREMLTNYDKGLPVSTPKITVSEFLNQWLQDYCQINVSPRTYRSYEGMIRRYVKPAIGHIQISKLSPHYIQSIYTDMTNQGLSAQTILHTHRCLSKALKCAVKWEIAVRNVCDSVEFPRPKRKEMAYWTAEQVNQFLTTLNHSDYNAVFFLAIHTGMRRSEILGLQWKDLDIPNLQLSIQRTVYRVSGKGIVIGEPKTRQSRRSVTLTQEAAMLLAGLRSKYWEQRQYLELTVNDSDFVFSNAEGKPFRPHSVSTAFRRMAKRSGLPQIRFHDLRHTHATLLLQQGVHPKIVSERLGHSDINITLNTYSHVMPNMQSEAAEAFSGLLNGSNDITPCFEGAISPK